jgi:hypothetical protein
MLAASLLAWFVLTRRNIAKAGLPELGWPVQLAAYFPVLVTGTALQTMLSWVQAPEAGFLTYVPVALAALATVLTAGTVSAMGLQSVRWYTGNARYLGKRQAD